MGAVNASLIDERFVKITIVPMLSLCIVVNRIRQKFDWKLVLLYYEILASQ